MGTNTQETFTFTALPQNPEELKALPEAQLSTPFMTAALTVAALCRYESSPEDTIQMLDFLRGPRPMSPYDQQFLRDRLRGKAYVPRSYFKGSTPANSYQPAQPYSLTIFTNPYSYAEEDYSKLFISSGGADSERAIQLRVKGEKWYLWENFLLADIRIPEADDPWK